MLGNWPDIVSLYIDNYSLTYRYVCYASNCDKYHIRSVTVVIIGYCINTTFYGRGHVSDALPSLRGNALPRHERGHKMLYLCTNLIIIYPYKINRNHVDMYVIEIVSIIFIYMKNDPT